MDTTRTESAPSPETKVERQLRLTREGQKIAEALASVEAGRTVPSEDVDAWIDSIGTDHERPPPSSGR